MVEHPKSHHRLVFPENKVTELDEKDKRIKLGRKHIGLKIQKKKS